MKTTLFYINFVTDSDRVIVIQSDIIYLVKKTAVPTTTMSSIPSNTELVSILEHRMINIELL